MIGRALLVWLGILVLANVNGALRELLLVPAMGTTAAHVVSTVLLCIVVLVGTALTIDWIAPAAAGDAMVVGALWLTLTLAFEFLVGHYVFGVPWMTLRADYDVAAGRIWPLALLIVAFAPWLMSQLKLRRTSEDLVGPRRTS